MDPSHYAPGLPKATPRCPDRGHTPVSAQPGAQGPPPLSPAQGGKCGTHQELTPPASLGTTKVPVPPTGHVTSLDPCPLLQIKELD